MWPTTNSTFLLMRGTSLTWNRPPLGSHTQGLGTISHTIPMVIWFCWLVVSCDRNHNLVLVFSLLGFVEKMLCAIVRLVRNRMLPVAILVKNRSFCHRRLNNISPGSFYYYPLLDEHFVNAGRENSRAWLSESAMITSKSEWGAIAGVKFWREESHFWMTEGTKQCRDPIGLMKIHTSVKKSVFVI